MKKKSKISLLVITSLMAVTPLVGCGNTDPVTPPVPPVPEKVDSLKNGLLYLNRGNNYTLAYEAETSGVAHQYLFTPSSIGVVCEEVPSNDRIFYGDGKGVYSIGFNGKNHVGSEYYTGLTNDVWSGIYMSSFKGVATNYVENIDASKTTLEIKDKAYKTGFVQVIGYASSDYLNLTSLVATFDASKTEVVFTAVYSGRTYKFHAKNFGITKNKILDDYLENGGKAYVPTTLQKVIRDDFLCNNYTQGLYQLGEDETTTGYVGEICFHQNYYLTTYYSAPKAASGVAYIDGKNPVHPETSYHGIYSVMTDHTEGSETPVQFMDYCITDKYTVPEYYNYPSFLNIWNHLEYLLPWDNKVIALSEYRPQGQTKGENITSFVITDPNLVYDIQNNFNIMGSFEGATPVSVGIDMYPDVQLRDTIVFVLKFQYAGLNYIYLAPFYNFNNSADAILDWFLAQFHN